MTRFSRRAMLALAAGLTLATSAAWSAEQWVEGKHYYRLKQPQATQPGVVTVTEIFSYGCPACNAFVPYMQSLEKKLPPKVVVEYLPASWIAAENWPALQRAYITAKALGVDKKTHAAMFDAIWKTGELGITDARTNRIKSTLPSIQDMARFYERTAAIPAAKFVETSKSFSVDTEMRRDDSLIKSYQAESTPTLIINGKYRLGPQSAGTSERMVEIALWLVQQELQKK
jgi:protein dithiol oxidoreductase (disulfide-forming)